MTFKSRHCGEPKQQLVTVIAVDDPSGRFREPFRLINLPQPFVELASDCRIELPFGHGDQQGALLR